ncbi:MAG: hypothetical protein IJI68_00675 [Eggerthellaceae bacterium]|nr:hypothetical protein [Eggerthellaceae bacterium]
MDALHEEMRRAHAAWQQNRAKKSETKKPEMARYAIIFTCTAEEFESVKLSLAGRELHDKKCRYVPLGWMPGEPL